MERILGVGEYYISGNLSDIIKIYGLASCIGLVLYCPSIKVLAMAHILLPNSDINLDLSKISPAYFADTGVDFLVKSLLTNYPVTKNDIVASMFGGAEARTKTDLFNIGARNAQTVKQKLEENGIKLALSHIGGNYSRTIEVSVSTGKAKLYLQKFDV